MQNLDHKTEHYLLFSRKIFLKSMFISRDTTKAQTVSHFLQKKYLNSTHTTFVRLQKKLLDKDYVMPFEISLRSQQTLIFLAFTLFRDLGYPRN